MDTHTTGRRLQAAVIAQLFANHVLALLIPWWIVLRGREITLPRALLALGMAGLLGVLLTANLHRALSRLYRAVVSLNLTLPVTPLHPSRFDPLAPLLRQFDALARRDVGSLRESLLTQTREAAAQEERNRLARDLHDSIKQQLFSIHISAAAIGARWSSDSAGAQMALSDVRSSVREAMVEMDALLQQLAPAPLDRVGLVEALRQQAEALSYRTGVPVDVQIDELPGDERLPAGSQKALFRVAQEGLNNVARHARANRIALRLYAGNGHVHLVVEDDGQGFTPGTPSPGMGLANMRTRLAALDGSLRVSSQPGSGTTVHASLPLVDTSIQEEDPMQKIDHTLNKLFLVATGGGLAIIAALYVPIYVLLPGQYVPRWPSAPQVLSIPLMLTAVAFAVSTGWLAVRWTKPATRPLATLIGATAGLFAALIAFVGIGAGAAGVVGAQPLLEWGFRPADGHLHLLQIAIESTLGVFAWNYRVLWGAVLGGAGLGALGSLLAPLGETRPHAANLRRAAVMLLDLGLLGAALALTLHVPLFPRIGIRFGQIVDQWRVLLSAPVELPFAPSALPLWPVGSAATAFVMLLAARTLIERADALSEDPERLFDAYRSGAMLAAWPVIVGAFLLWIVPLDYLQRVWVPLAVGAGLSLILAAVCAVSAWQAGRALARRGLMRSTGIRVGGLVLGLVVFAIASMLFLLPGLNGWSRNGLNLTLLNNMISDFNIGVQSGGLDHPYQIPINGVPLLGQYTMFHQMPTVKLVLGLLGMILARWLLSQSALSQSIHITLRAARPRTIQTAAGTLLGLILVASLAVTLPGTASTSFNYLLIHNVGQELFREGGAVPNPYYPSDTHPQVMPLWPLSTYGPNVTERPSRYTEEDIAQQTEWSGRSEAEVREQYENYENGVYALRSTYRQQYILAIAYPVAMLVISGLIWLGVAGVDALAWRRAKELVGQSSEEGQ